MIIHHRAQDVPKIRAKYAEIDVMMCNDFTVVCRHDHEYEGKAIWEQPYSYGMGPTLKDFLLRTTAELIIELKMPSNHRGAGLKVFEKAVASLAPDAFAFSSFDWACLVRLRDLLPDAVLIANTHDNRLPATVPQIATIANGVAVPKSWLQHHMIAHRLPTFVYGVNDPSEVTDERVVGIITDHPEKWDE